MSEGYTGRPTVDNHRFINAVFWIFRTGAPCRELPTYHGDSKNTHRRFSRGRYNGIWEKILDVLSWNPDYTWLMIDATLVKCNNNSAGERGSKQRMSVSKGGSTVRYMWPWMRMVCRSELLLQMVSQMIVQRLNN